MWWQALIGLVVWLAAGYLTWKKLQGRWSGPRWAPPILMLAGAAVLFGGMMVLAGNGGIEDGRLVPWAWGATIVIGCVFVGLQTAAAVSAVARFGDDDKPSDR